jgi:predicted Fe-Mo cluster-binding NifX family protein
MRIAFPTNTKKTISSHIGLAKGFLIIDTITGKQFYIENPVLKNIKENHINLKEKSEGNRKLGAGIIINDLLRDYNVDVFIANEFGNGMLKNLEKNRIKAIITQHKNIEDVLLEFKK